MAFVLTVVTGMPVLFVVFHDKAKRTQQGNLLGSLQTKTRVSILAQSFGSGSAQPLGCVWVGANFQFQLSFDIAASREKLREASENNSFKTASSVSAAPGPHNHWISEPRHYECLFKSN